MQKSKTTKVIGHRVDKWLLISFACLLSVGMVMVTSSSLPIAEKHNLPVFYFAWHNIMYILLGLFN